MDGIGSVAHQSGRNMPDRFSGHDVIFPVVKGNIAGAPFEALDLTEVDVEYALSRSAGTACQKLTPDTGGKCPEAFVISAHKRRSRRRIIGIAAGFCAEIHDSAVFDKDHTLVDLDIDAGSRSNDVLIPALVLRTFAGNLLAPLHEDTGHVPALEIVHP